MNDHELLELAARAAGYDKTMQAFNFADRDGNFIVYVKHVYWENGREHREYWSPLTDDGDALLLAVKVGFVIEVGYAARGFIVMRTNTDDWQEFRESFGQDTYAATRRAIVRAAAEIGRTL